MFQTNGGQGDRPRSPKPAQIGFAALITLGYSLQESRPRWFGAKAELVARMHSMLRRVEAKSENQKISYADVNLNPSTREAKHGGRHYAGEFHQGFSEFRKKLAW